MQQSAIMVLLVNSTYNGVQLIEDRFVVIKKVNSFVLPKPK